MVRVARILQCVAIVFAVIASAAASAYAGSRHGRLWPLSAAIFQAPAIAELFPSAAKASQPPPRRKSRRILRVGPKRKLRAPSHAARIARAGDHIRIDAGEYRDCAVWRADGLILEGVGGYAHVRDKSCEGKGIWIIRGGHTTVMNMEFSGADVPDNNGAGIKFQGGGVLIVRNSYFHDNENGIQGGNRPRARVVISGSRFERNGKCKPECAHGIYIGHIRSLRIVGSSFTGQMVGHHIKSRARYTEIVGNRILDGATGTASFSINLPNGGTARIRDNILQKGRRSQNHTAMIAIGEEGATNPSRGIFIERNVFNNQHPRLRQFIWNRSRQVVTLRANRFTGKGRHLKGPGRIP